MSVALKAPFPYFGGKSRIAATVWEVIGPVKNYVEPFFGSGAVLLGRPDAPQIETVNDADGFLANFWRATQADPGAVARWADWPVNENDLHARHAWLVRRRDDLTARLEGDALFYDAQIAGWWVWGACCWIGGGWCSGDGPWRLVDGRLLDVRQLGGDAGRGINRQLPHLGDAGRGINRQLPHLGDAGQGINQNQSALLDSFAALSARLRHVRVACGDWSRVCGPSVTHRHGLTGVFLDPPYADTAGRDNKLYAVESTTVAHDVRAWAIDNGSRQDMRIVLAGYEGEHDMPPDWRVIRWDQGKGYGGQRKDGANNNGKRERLWCSPACLDLGQGSLF